MSIYEHMNTVTSHHKLRLSLNIPDGPFIPGDLVRGTLVVDCRAQTGTLALGDLVVELIGNQVLRSRDHLADNNPVHLRRVFQGGTLPPSNAVTDSASSWLGNWDGLPTGFFPALKGETTFAFEFELPSWAPATVNFSTGTAEIGYEVRATAGLFWRGERRYLQSKRIIAVLEPYHPTDSDTRQESRLTEDGRFWVGLAVRSDFTAGSPAEAMVVVRNHSTRKTTSLSLSIEQFLIVLLPSATSRIQLSEEVFQQSFDGPEYEVAAGEEAAASLEFDIPLDACGSSPPTVESSNEYVPYFFVETRVRVSLGIGLSGSSVSVSVPITVWHPAAVSAQERGQHVILPAKPYSPERLSPLRRSFARGSVTGHVPASRSTYTASSLLESDLWSPSDLWSATSPPATSAAAAVAANSLHHSYSPTPQGVYHARLQSPYSSPGLEHARGYTPVFSPHQASPVARPLPTPPAPLSPLSPSLPKPAILSPRPVVRQRRSYDGNRSLSESVRTLERMALEEEITPKVLVEDAPKSLSEEGPLTPPLFGVSNDIWQPKSDDVVQSPWNWKPVPPGSASSTNMRGRAQSYGDIADAVRPFTGIPPAYAELAAGGRAKPRTSAPPVLPRDVIDRMTRSNAPELEAYRIASLSRDNRSPSSSDTRGLDKWDNYTAQRRPSQGDSQLSPYKTSETTLLGPTYRLGRPLDAVSPNVDVRGTAAQVGTMRGSRGSIVTSLGAIVESSSMPYLNPLLSGDASRRAAPTTGYHSPGYSPSFPVELTSAYGEHDLSPAASLSRPSRAEEREADNRMYYGRAQVRDTMERYEYQS